MRQKLFLIGAIFLLTSMAFAGAKRITDITGTETVTLYDADSSGTINPGIDKQPSAPVTIS